MFRPSFVFAASLILGAVAPSTAWAAEWFVAPGGTGSGTRDAPFGRVQDGIRAALPGDTVMVRGGVYREALRTVRSGAVDEPIVVRAAPESGPALVTTTGTVLRVEHAHLVFEDLILDGQYANAVGISVNNGGSFLLLRRIEVRRSGRDCVDLAGPQSVVIEDSLIHHCLYPANGRSDAHGIVGGAVRNLTIRGTEIHTFSGDGIQLDPSRDPSGWDSVLIERCRIWLAPLAHAENGFAAGVVPGENALDTKVSNDAPRARLVVRNTEAWGFRGAISNQAAFNLKENIDARIDGVTVWDSEIAFRLRGAPNSFGAWVVVQNAVIHDVTTAIRYEDNIQNLRVWNSTFGLNVGSPFQAASSSRTGLDVRNVLLLSSRLPPEAVDRSNMMVSADAVINALAGDYRLASRSSAIDGGSMIDAVVVDRDGVRRPQGDAPDVGAYEWHKPTVIESPTNVFGPVRSRSR